MTLITKCLLFAFISCAFFCASARAQTINAASCSENDVVNALNSITSSTTTVNIPAGTCTWTKPLSYTFRTAIAIIGAGSQSVVGGGDVTVIIDGLIYTEPDPQLLAVTANGSSFRLSGITFRGSGVFQTYNGAFSITGTSQQVRVDHVHFDHINSIGFTTNGSITGVFDHILGDGVTGSGYRIDSGSWLGASFGDGAWADATALGSSKFLFFEDSVFNDFGNDSTQGGRWVVRHCTITVKVGTGALQTHPTGGAGRDRGSRAWEIYDNTFSHPGGSNNNLFFLSSGTGVIWGNSAPTGFQNFITLHSMRRDNSTYSESAPPSGWGYCGTSFSGTGSPWDQNANTTTGGNCLDQPGQGKGDLLTGNVPHTVNTATGTVAYPHQALEPIYEWLNNWVPVPGFPTKSLMSNYDPDVLIANQNYFLYTPTFDGTSGVGSGLLSARPSSCKPLVAYWATDTETLYQCSSANNWAVYYQPYTYPHPLTQGSVASGPPAPSGLTATVSPSF